MKKNPSYSRICRALTVVTFTCACLFFHQPSSQAALMVPGAEETNVRPSPTIEEALAARGLGQPAMNRFAGLWNFDAVLGNPHTSVPPLTGSGITFGGTRALEEPMLVPELATWLAAVVVSFLSVVGLMRRARARLKIEN